MEKWWESLGLCGGRWEIHGTHSLRVKDYTSNCIRTHIPFTGFVELCRSIYFNPDCPLQRVSYIIKSMCMKKLNFTVAFTYH